MLNYSYVLSITRGNVARTKDGIGRIGADLHLSGIDEPLVNSFSPLLDTLEIDPAIKSSIERFSGSAENNPGHMNHIGMHD